MLPNLTLCRSGCTVDSSWDELVDDLRRLVLEKSRSAPIPVVTSQSPWFITAQMDEGGVAVDSDHTDLMAELIGKSAPTAFDLLFKKVREIYIGYSPKL